MRVYAPRVAQPTAVISCACAILLRRSKKKYYGASARRPRVRAVSLILRDIIFSLMICVIYHIA